MDTERNNLIAALERNRSSRVIAYLTSDRPPFNATIQLDVIPLFHQILKVIGSTEKISLFLYSSGGSLDAPWPLMNLIREYCKEVEILIPFRALSAATLLALGADKIVMTPFKRIKSY